MAPPLPDLDRIEAVCREMAGEVRAAGEVLDRDPAALEVLAGLPAADLLRCAATPPPYRHGVIPPDGLVLTGTSCREWTAVLEGIARADAGIALACPGPSLPGAAVTGLGDDVQRERFFSQLTGPKWTFFAMTEPAKGSAVLELQTRLTAVPEDGGWTLDGVKCHVMNGERATTGVVFCRRAPGPWGIEAVLVDTADPGFHAEPEDTLGLRGAALSRIRFDRVHVPADRVLGAHLPLLRRGINGALRALLRCRPPVAGLALGLARSALDCVCETRTALPKAACSRIDGLADRIAAVRAITYEAASDVDLGNLASVRIPVAKARAARLAGEATGLAAELLGPASLVDHPRLARMCRDARGFEFMEGAGDIHRLTVFQALLTGELLRPR
jgi:alkylation response protein AidB-like acyl-CoA dehydrogenase